MNKFNRIALATGGTIDPTTLERMVNDPAYSLAQIAAAAGTSPSAMANLLLDHSDEPLPVVTSGGSI